MTSAHFNAIASVINSVGYHNSGNADILLKVAQGLADAFIEFTPNFNRAKFISACFTYQKD